MKRDIGKDTNNPREAAVKSGLPGDCHVYAQNPFQRRTGRTRLKINLYIDGIGAYVV